MERAALSSGAATCGSAPLANRRGVIGRATGAQEIRGRELNVITHFPAVCQWWKMLRVWSPRLLELQNMRRALYAEFKASNADGSI